MSSDISKAYPRARFLPCRIVDTLHTIRPMLNSFWGERTFKQWSSGSLISNLVSIIGHLPLSWPKREPVPTLADATLNQITIHKLNLVIAALNEERDQLKKKVQHLTTALPEARGAH